MARRGNRLGLKWPAVLVQKCVWIMSRLQETRVAVDGVNKAGSPALPD